jgi:sterol desaturase/sphingolipid hydroxylase (fatty acid hydroxylase superfamily)
MDTGTAGRPSLGLIAILALAALVAALGFWPEFLPSLEPFGRVLLGSHYSHAAWFVSKSVENVAYNFFGLFTAPVTLGDRLHWINILGFIGFAAVAFVIYDRERRWRGVRAFVRHLFPLQYYGHPSAGIDYQIFLINRLFTPARPITRALSETAMAALVLSGLTASLGPPLGAAVPGLWGLAVYTIAVAIVVDFADWTTHALMHRVPALWEFHKVHHSAEVLTPITVYRIHPVEQVIGALVTMLISGCFSGVMAYLLLEQPTLLTLFGANAVITLFQAAGNHLRHSHIWLSWGWVVNHIFISPAQHQIHHSVDPKHWDKNYGFIFALWDWMFGTLYVPKEKEQLTFGLGGATQQIHPTIWAAYFLPFQAAWNVMLRAVRRPPARGPTHTA